MLGTAHVSDWSARYRDGRDRGDGAGDGSGLDRGRLTYLSLWWRVVLEDAPEPLVQPRLLARSSIAWQASINASNGSASSSSHRSSTIRA